MAYLVVIHSVDNVMLPGSAFAGGRHAQEGAWYPTECCRALILQMGCLLDDVQEFTTTGLPPSRVFHCRARAEATVERLLHGLALHCGIGNDDTQVCGSVSVISLELARPSFDQKPGAHSSGSARGQQLSLGAGVQDIANSGNSPWQAPTPRAATSRILADKVLLRILAGSSTSFDYHVLVGMASLLAALGLATNNPVVVVAAMLVSPLMGPVLGITFGLFVSDRKLLRRAWHAEFLGLLLALLVGGIVGIAFTPFVSVFAWPTQEMASRGTWWGLIIGIAIALPSGAGVALSITGDNASSLVGVAISASLLPPVVNAGMCWVAAIAASASSQDVTTASAYAIMGAISVALTVINVLCIILGALVVFMIKGAAPLPNRGTLFHAVTRSLRGHAQVQPISHSSPTPAVTSATAPDAAADSLPSLGSFSTRYRSRPPLSDFGPTFATVAAGPYGGRASERAAEKLSLQEAITLMQSAAAAGRATVLGAVRVDSPRGPLH